MRTLVGSLIALASAACVEGGMEWGPAWDPAPMASTTSAARDELALHHRFGMAARGAEEASIEMARHGAVMGEALADLHGIVAGLALRDGATAALFGDLGDALAAELEDYFAAVLEPRTDLRELCEGHVARSAHLLDEMDAALAGMGSHMPYVPNPH